MHLWMLSWVVWCPPQNSCLPRTSECDLIWKWVFADVISSGTCNETIPDLGWALNVLTGVFITEGKGNLNPETEKQAMRGQRQNLQ